MGGWISPIIMPLRGPSCKLRLARVSDKLKFQDGPSVAKTKTLKATVTCDVVITQMK